MSVWVLQADYNYDGSMVVGVFSTEEKAKEGKSRLAKYYGDIDIIEWVVDEVNE